MDICYYHSDLWTEALVVKFVLHTIRVMTLLSLSVDHAVGDWCHLIKVENLALVHVRTARNQLLLSLLSLPSFLLCHRCVCHSLVLWSPHCPGLFQNLLLLNWLLFLQVTAAVF